MNTNLNTVTLAHAAAVGMTPFELDAVADWHDQEAEFAQAEARKRKNDPEAVFDCNASAERHDQVSFQLRKVAAALR